MCVFGGIASCFPCYAFSLRMFNCVGEGNIENTECLGGYIMCHRCRVDVGSRYQMTVDEPQVCNKHHAHTSIYFVVMYVPDLDRGEGPQLASVATWFWEFL